MAPHPSNPGVSRESLRLLYSPFVTLKVGPEKREFCVHRDLLCHHSKYFQKAFKNGNFEESRTGISTIENVDFRLMKIFVSWLYNGKLLYTLEDFPEDPGEDPMFDFEDDDGDCLIYTPKGLNPHFADGERQEIPFCETSTTWYWRTLVRLYIFADYFDVPSLCALVMDTLIDKSDFGYSLPGREEITHAYRNTAEGSRLRKFLVDLYAYKSKPVWAGWWLSMPKRFLADVMVVNMKDRCSEVTAKVREDIRKTSPRRDLAAFTYDRCVYHEHKTKEERQQCRERRGVSLAENEEDYVDVEGKKDKEEDEEEDENEDEDEDEDEDEEEENPDEKDD